MTASSIRPSAWLSAVILGLGLHAILVTAVAMRHLPIKASEGVASVVIDLPPAETSPAPTPPAPLPDQPPPLPSPPRKPVASNQQRSASAARPAAPLPVAPSLVEAQAARISNDAVAEASTVSPQSSSPAVPSSAASLGATTSSMPPTWIGRIMARLERFKRYPSEARAAHLEGTAYIGFRIDRQGTVLAASIARTSGVELLDSEARALLDRASPLPVPPDDVKGDTIELVVPIAFGLH